MANVSNANVSKNLSNRAMVANNRGDYVGVDFSDCDYNLNSDMVVEKLLDFGQAIFGTQFPVSVIIGTEQIGTRGDWPADMPK